MRVNVRAGGDLEQFFFYVYAEEAVFDLAQIRMCSTDRRYKCTVAKEVNDPQGWLFYLLCFILDYIFIILLVLS